MAKLTAYQRGYIKARQEMSEALQANNQRLAARMVAPKKAQLLDAFGSPIGEKPLDDYDRGVLAGAVTANRTMLMFLGHTNEGTGPVAQAGD